MHRRVKDILGLSPNHIQQELPLAAEMFWNTVCHCCRYFMQRSHPVTHPPEYLEWATHGWTQRSTHTLTSRCWKCAGFHMYTHECRQIVTHRRRQTWVTPPKLPLRGHPHPTSTLLFSLLPLYLGGGGTMASPALRCQRRRWEPCCSSDWGWDPS